MSIPRSPQRLAWLDALRGISALAVLLAHAIPHATGSSQAVPWFDIGHAGVLVFFLCSGWIVPESLKRTGSLQWFWIRRFWRLYPLYWLSIFLVVGFYLLGIDSPFFHEPTLLLVLVTLTMFQPFLGFPYLLSLYWTLFYEMLFYLELSLLYVMGYYHRIVSTTAISLVAIIAAVIMLPRTIGLTFPITLLSYPTLMLVGAVVNQVAEGRVSKWAGAVVGTLAIAMLMLTTPGVVDGAALEYDLLTARCGAVLLFICGVMWRSHPVPQIIVMLGRVSYSIYLLHPFVLAMVPPFGGAFVTVIAWSIFTVALSIMTYHVIEQPGVAIAQRRTKGAVETVRQDRSSGAAAS